jgi:hypothetical protein
MSVLVLIWLPNPFTGNLGHGSMWIMGKGAKFASVAGWDSSGAYVSNWPGDDSIFKTFVYGKGKAQTQEQDFEAEGSPPDCIYKIDGLDEIALARRWAVLRKDLKYSAASYNRFTTIAEVISAGLTTFWQQKLGDTILDHKLVTYHSAMLFYLYQVQLAVDKRITRPSDGKATVPPASSYPDPLAVITIPRTPG